MRLETVSGAALAGHVPALARLRMTVFREYPYLYDGSEAYEADYLARYTASGEAFAVLAFDGDAVVGASTGVPMVHEDEAFRAPFARLGIDPLQVFYCGESVLLPAWRGRGVYRDFFAARERYAGALDGIEWMAFCAVVRPPDHPLRPAGYQPLDPTWRHFGYTPEPRLLAHFDWKDIDQPTASAHPMQFWLKRLDESGSPR